MKSRGFTLVEALAALLVLVIGFSALYFWFLGAGILSARDRTRTEAQLLLAGTAEQLIARPISVVDSQWTEVLNQDTFSLTLDVLDSGDYRKIADSLEIASVRSDRFVQRPPEASLHLCTESSRHAQYCTSLYFVVGGVLHVIP
ncbi:MAG TPA: prepilin-type N-terminal cleavage/methylation domain-containing protein [Fibrobacteraceae bacterium]|nr:prepilin-type N-terminal cleavage/methylation domain-containing protein [Fibrobacteraceae bacterium]